MRHAADSPAVVVAYLFLAGTVPTEHRDAWERYFEGCPAGSHSVHVHTQGVSPWQFAGSRTLPGEETVHGALRFSYRMVKAQLRLYESALTHPTSGGGEPTWLQLLSSSTVPLSDCATVHARLAGGERRTYLDGGPCATNMGRHVCVGRQPTRYSPAAGGEFLWAPQWSTLLADDARLLLQHERANEAVWFDPKGKSLLGPEVLDVTAADEHYLPNVLRDLGVRTQTATLTWITPIDSSMISSKEDSTNHTIQGIVERVMQDAQASIPGGISALPGAGSTLTPGGGGGVLALLSNAVTGSAMSIGLLGSLILSPASWSMLRDALTTQIRPQLDVWGHPVSLDCGAVADAARIELAHQAGFSFLRKATGDCTRLIKSMLSASRAQGASRLAAVSAQPHPNFRDSVAANFPGHQPALGLALANHRQSTDEDLKLDYFIMQPLRWLDQARGGEDACSIGLVDSALTLRQRDVRRQSKSLRLAEMMVSDMADLTTLPDILNWNYTAPLDILALLPGWGPENICEAGQHRCSARLRPPRAAGKAQGGDGGSLVGEQVNMFLGACVPSACQGAALEESFHLMRRGASRIMQQRVNKGQAPSEGTLALIREFGAEDRPLANVQIACAGDLLPPQHWHHMLAAGLAFAALAFVPHLLPRRRPRLASASPGALQAEAAAGSRLDFAEGVRVLAIGLIVLGHVFGMTVTIGFWNLAGDGSSLSDFLGESINLHVGSSMALQTFNFLSAFFAWSKLLKGREALAGANIEPYLRMYAVRVVRYLPTLLSAYLLFPRLLFYLETSSSPGYFMLSDARQANLCGASGLARHIAILFFPYNMVHGERYEGLCMPHGWFLAQDANLFALTLMLYWGWTRLAGASDRALMCACAVLWAAGTVRFATRVVADDVTIFSFAWFVVEHRAVHCGIAACMGGVISAHLHNRGISFGATVRGSTTARLLAEWAACAAVVLVFAAYPVAFQIMIKTAPTEGVTVGSFNGAAVHFTQSAVWLLCNRLIVSVLTTTSHTLGMMLLFFMCSGPRTGGLSGLMRRALSLDVFTLLAPYTFAIYMVNQLIIVLLVARTHEQLSIPGWKDIQHLLALVVWMMVVCMAGGAALHHMIEEPWAAVDWARLYMKRSAREASVLPDPIDAKGEYVVVSDSTASASKLDIAQIGAGAMTAQELSGSPASRLLVGDEREQSQRPAKTRVQLMLLIACVGFVLGRWSSPTIESVCPQFPPAHLARLSHTKPRPRRIWSAAHTGTSRNASVMAFRRPHVDRSQRASSLNTPKQ